MELPKTWKNGAQGVSRLYLGCMSYCSLEKGSHTGALNEEKSRSFIEKALELGINFFDTATSIQTTPAKRCWGGRFRS